MQKHRAVLWVAVTLIAVHAAANPEPVTHHFPDLIVRPGRNLMPNPVAESPALEAARIELTAGDLLLLKPATASEALKVAPGVHTETRGRKYKQFHSFRGQIYPYPDVTVDGIWQREALELFYVYPGAALERVEILRSASTLFHGLADVVGVVNLVPHRPRLDPDMPPTLELGMEAGSYGTLRGFGYGEVQGGETTAFTLGSQYYRTDGRSGRNAAEEISSLFGSGLFQPDPDHRLTFGAWVLHGYRELEMPDPDGPAQNSLKNQRERYDPLTYSHLHVRGLHYWTGRSTTDWNVFYSDRRSEYSRRKIDPSRPGPGNADASEDDREYGAQVIQGLSLSPANTARLGVFLHRWTAPNGKQSYVGSRQDVSSYALVLSDEHQLGDWTFDAGIRYARSYFHDFSGPSFTITGQSTRTQPVQEEWDDPVLSGTMGVTVALDGRNRLSLHGGVGGRRPGPGAIRPDGRAPADEQRYAADGGWTMQWGAMGDGSLKLGAFGVWRRDAIVRINQTGVDENGNEFYFSGNNDLRQQGLELELQTPGVWQRRLNLVGSVTWMRSEVDTEDGYDRYREVPSLIVSAGLRMTEGLWDAALWVKHVDEYENFRFAQDGKYHALGDYWDLTLSGGVRLGRERATRLYGAIDNLLDDDYSTVVGWSDPGRRFRVGLERSF